jgi:hypothetical protein
MALLCHWQFLKVRLYTEAEDNQLDHLEHRAYLLLSLELLHREGTTQGACVYRSGKGFFVCRFPNAILSNTVITDAFKFSSPDTFITIYTMTHLITLLTSNEMFFSKISKSDRVISGAN